MATDHKDICFLVIHTYHVEVLILVRFTVSATTCHTTPAMMATKGRLGVTIGISYNFAQHINAVVPASTKATCDLCL